MLHGMHKPINDLCISRETNKSAFPFFFISLLMYHRYDLFNQTAWFVG